jgi:hypothetical protein
LFDDLESQLEQGLDAEAGLRVEEERLRIARLGLRDRLCAVTAGRSRDEDYSIRIALISGEVARVRPLTIGKDWLSGDLRDGARDERQCIIPFAAIASLLLDRAELARSLEAAPEQEALVGRLGFAFILRDLARRRAAVDIAVRDGRFPGTIDRVGRDHLDLAQHDAGEPRRESAVRVYRVLPLEHIVAVTV